MPELEVRYADVMRPLNLGYGLWQADPFDEYSKITLGSAGEIKKGKLTPRWQMWQDASYLEDLIHRQRLQARKPLHTTNWKEEDAEFFVPSDPLSAPASAGFGIGYRCTESRAGLLSLKDGYAISENLQNRREKELTEYLISNHEEIMSACEIEDLEELTVVTGTTMTGDWDAVYLESNNREGRVSVKAGVSHVVLQRTNVVVTHSQNQNPSLSSGHRHNPPRNPGGSCCEEVKNQCIFVRTLRLRRRPLRKTPKVIKAAAEPKEYDRDSDTGYDTDGILSDSTDSIGSSSAEENLLVVKDEDDEVLQAPDLVDQAFDYIFSNCNAELAILHDRDIEKMMGGLIGNSSPTLQIAINEEFSVASLFHEDNPAVDSEWDIVNSTTPNAYPELLSNANSGDEERIWQARATATPDTPASLSVKQEYTDNPHEPSLSPWQRIHRRFPQWALTLPVSEFENHLQRTLPGHKVDEAAAQIWLYQVYKRYSCTRVAERPPQNVDFLFIPFLTADGINTAVLAGRDGAAFALLKDLWSFFGFERPPRLLLTLERHSED